ncbi:hypothetical protein GGC63_000246 [Paenibacillus sp. OAS669]|nr:hypothetical protein [Paenibacillus sp. OAS669]
MHRMRDVQANTGLDEYYSVDRGFFVLSSREGAA